MSRYTGHRNIARDGLEWALPQSSENPSIEADPLKAVPGSTRNATSRNGNGHPGDAASDGLVLPGETTTSLEPADLLDALQAVRLGDFSVRLPTHFAGLAGKIADVFNDIVAANERMAQQLENVGQVVGRDGKTRTRIKLRHSATAPGATWRTRSTP